MNWQYPLATAAYFILSLGGGGAIVLGLSNWIGRILGDRYVEKVKHELEEEIESYKTQLRKSEFLFQKEFEAASQFLSLRRRLWPRYRFPEMDWHEACEDFASNFENVEKELEGYMATHGAALNQKALDRLSNALEQTASGKFEVSGDTGDTVSGEGIDIADKVMDELRAIEKELHEAVWSQSSTRPSMRAEVA
jgi:hypothetical protein